MIGLALDEHGVIYALRRGVSGYSDTQLSGFKRVVLVPDQDIGGIVKADEQGVEVDFGRVEDYSQATQAELAAAVDCDTGRAIDAAVHPVAGVDEQLGILRDQLVHVLNALGIEPTADFARLNEVAIASIADGQLRKAAL